MTTFDDIQDIWKKQSELEIRASQPEELIQLAEKNTRKIKVKQFWTIGILGVSVLFFFWYSLVIVGFQFSWFHIGIALMLFSLLFRLIVEYISYVSIRRIDIRSDFTNYTKGISDFYRKRKKIHCVVTPISVAVYIIGFIFLVPVLKKSFSPAFFWYIIISGWILLILFAVMLIQQIKKEMRLLNFFKDVNL
jgi:hypothetical protein